MLHPTSSVPPPPSPATIPKKKHTLLPPKDKLEPIKKREAGMAHSAAAAQMGVPQPTAPTIWKNQRGTTSRPAHSETSGRGPLTSQGETLGCVA